MGKFCHTNDGNLSKQQKWLALGFRLEIRLKLLARMQFSADLMISASCWCLHFCLIYKHWYRYMSSKQSCHIMGSLRGWISENSHSLIMTHYVYFSLGIMYIPQLLVVHKWQARIYCTCLHFGFCSYAYCVFITSLFCVIPLSCFRLSVRS